MWDTTVRMISLAMRAASLEDLPVFAVPARYGWRFYQPGDERLLGAHRDLGRRV